MTDMSTALKSKLDQYFDITKYDRCSELSLVQWVNLAEMRYAYLTAGKNELKEYSTLIENRVLIEPLPETISDKLSSIPITGNAVNDFSLLDHTVCQEMIEKMPDISAICNAFNSYCDGTNDDDCDESIIDKVHDSLLTHSLSQKVFPLAHPYFYLTVNLEATDETIMSEVLSWLKEKRKTLSQHFDDLNPPIKFDKKTFNAWSRYKVLAFIDLKILQHLYSEELPNHFIADLLFPREAGVDFSERVRKVVEPKAEVLLSSSTIEAMRLDAMRNNRPE
jgi:Family of unknown function (DUF6387)